MPSDFLRDFNISFLTPSSNVVVIVWPTLHIFIVYIALSGRNFGKPAKCPQKYFIKFWVAEICTGLAGKFRQVFATLHNMVGAKEIHTYLEQQQTEKLETKVRDVKRIRITKVYACCLSEAYATKNFLQPATSQPRLHGMPCLCMLISGWSLSMGYLWAYISSTLKLVVSIFEHTGHCRCALWTWGHCVVHCTVRSRHHRAFKEKLTIFPMYCMISILSWSLVQNIFVRRYS
jgi:hypothetical protein